MDWNANLLPDNPAKWQGTNATITGNTITLNNNGVAKTTLLREDLDYLPDFLQITIKYSTGQTISNYEPHFWAKIDIVDTNDVRYEYIAWMNQVELVAQNTWFVQTVVDITDADIKYITFAVYVDEDITEPIVISQRELRTSVALSKSQQDAINNQLPSVVFFSNSTQMVVTSALATVITSNFQLSASSNLLLHLIWSGVATNGSEITFSFQVNNTELSYSPMKHRIQAGNFLIGIPGSLLQVGSGNNTFIIRLSCSSGTLTFAKDGIYGTLDGKNILGGYSSEVPHAEITQLIAYRNIKGNYNFQTFVQAYLDTLFNNTLTQPIAYQNVVGSKEVTAIPSVEVTRAAVQENYMDDGTTVFYHHDEYIILDGSMQFKSNVIQETFYLINLTDTGAIYGIDLDNTSIKNYEAFTVVPLENSGIARNISNTYLYGKPDGKVYMEDSGTLVEIGTQPVTEEMFLTYGNTSLNTTLIQATPHISVYLYTDQETVYGYRLNAIATYIGKTVIQLEDFDTPTISSVLVTASSIPTDATFRMLFSVDGGATWWAYASNAWSQIPLENIGTSGMTQLSTSALAATQWSTLLGSNTTFRVAYYLEQATAANRLQIEQIRVNF